MTEFRVMIFDGSGSRCPVVPPILTKVYFVIGKHVGRTEFGYTVASGTYSTTRSGLETPAGKFQVKV